MPNRLSNSSDVGSPGKRYKNAPITEAVIEIRVLPHESMKRSSIESLIETLKSDFPKQVPMRMVRMGMTLPGQPEGGLSLSSSEQAIGFRLAKADDSRILQVRRNGLAYSHMAPYTQWSIFRSEARPLWEKYRTAFPGAKLDRCGLRYINRIDVPSQKVELEHYLRLYPEVPKSLPQQDVIGMVMSLQMPQKDIECMAAINQAQVEPPKPGHVSFVLDIDLFRHGIGDWGDSDVWAYLEKLRDRKNVIFEGCITDRTRELIDR